MMPILDMSIDPNGNILVLEQTKLGGTRISCSLPDSLQKFKAADLSKIKLKSKVRLLDMKAVISATDETIAMEILPAQNMISC